MSYLRSALVSVAVAILLAAYAAAGQESAPKDTSNVAAANTARRFAQQALSTALKPRKPPAYYIEQA